MWSPAFARRWTAIRRPLLPPRLKQESDRHLSRRLRFSAGRRRGDPPRHAIQQTVDPFAVLEAGQVAGDDGARRGQFGEMLSHLRYRNAGFLGKFRVESLTVLLEAIQDFGHGGYRVGGGTHCNRPGAGAVIPIRQPSPPNRA